MSVAGASCAADRFDLVDAGACPYMKCCAKPTSVGSGMTVAEHPNGFDLHVQSVIRTRHRQANVSILAQTVRCVQTQTRRHSPVCAGPSQLSSAAPSKALASVRNALLLPYCHV